jgi:hypothetical protein
MLGVAFLLGAAWSYRIPLAHAVRFSQTRLLTIVNAAGTETVVGDESGRTSLPIDFPLIDTPRPQRKLCGAAATQLDSAVCADSLIVKELSGQAERCFLGGSGVTTAAGFELGTAGMSQRVANANVFWCISATGACTVTAYCGDRS